MTLADRALRLIDTCCASMDAGERREGQRSMATAVAAAIEGERHLVVQAGTGTGKSLAYLAPAIMSGRTTVVATATKALQDQLADKELPLIAEHTARDVEWTVLKGRSNYLCLQRLAEAGAQGAQLGLEGMDHGSGLSAARLEEFQEFAATSATGDRADLDEEPPAHVWSAVSVGPRECPGASNCPHGDDCFAERARRSAAESDVIIVNTHLYGFHLAANRGVLPPHDIVIFDEAHEAEDILSATTGRQFGAHHLRDISRTVGSLIDDDALVDSLSTAGERLEAALAPRVGDRLRRGLPEDVAAIVTSVRGALMDAGGAVREIDDGIHPDVATRKARVATAIGAVVLDIDELLQPSDGSVIWVGGTDEHPRLESAPLDIGLVLDTLLWNPADDPMDDAAPEVPTTAIFTTATVPDGLAASLGIDASRVDELDAGTPFDFETNTLLYCAAHMPDPRADAYVDAVSDELERLITAAGGRTLALFTSHRAMQTQADALDDRLPMRILRQGELPKPALIAKFADDESSCLFATMGYWAGIDVPGPSLSLVTIDKLPFPRPDDPLLSARRERAAGGGFVTVDLPRATTRLAQGAGRLIRRADDRGVVAVLDPRLATKKSYRWNFIEALPPMPRTKDIAEVEAFLKPLLDG